MAAYFERISHPALANVKVSFAGMKVTDIYPQRIPELFVGRPVIITGRFVGDTNGHVTVSGVAGDQAMRYTFSTNDSQEENAAISDHRLGPA